jgi:hypothetical protein
VGVAPFELFLRRQTARTERWIHENDIETSPHQLNQGYPLSGVISKEPASHTATPCRGLGEAVKRIEQHRLRLLEEAHVIDLGEVQLLLSPLRLEPWEVFYRRLPNVLLSGLRQRRRDGKRRAIVERTRKYGERLGAGFTRPPNH